MPAFIVVNINDDHLAWSNEEGWTDTNFDTFSEYEKECFNLPIDGEWRQVFWRLD